MNTILLGLLAAATVFGASTENWIGTWGTAPASQPQTATEMMNAHLLFSNQTIREIVHVSAGGESIRLRLSNVYGTQPVTIGAIQVAISKGESSIDPATAHAVSFSGRSSVTIPANALVLSDPIPLHIAALSNLAISLYLPKAAAGAGIHYSAQQINYIAPGDSTKAASLPDATKISSWVFLTGVDVAAPENGSTVIAFGDSITDGAYATVDQNHRWSDFLAERLQADPKSQRLGVLDEGIGGNRILHDSEPGTHFGEAALARFDRDVLAQAGVRYVIVLEGINDIGHPGQSAPMSESVSADDLIAGLKQMIARCHEKGIKIFGATLTPFAIAKAPGYYSPEKDAKRKTLNEWIRTSGAFDGVIDFDKATRDPANPDQFLPAYDSGDHLHPHDPGYKAMAESIDLSLFQ